MRRWELSLALDQKREQPLFLQLATAIADDIRRGRLKPGEPLPGSRELAELLGVNRNTIVAGYGELAAEGLVSTRIGGGTFVAGRDFPLRARAQVVAANAPDDAPTYALAPPLPLPLFRGTHKPGMLVLSRSVPDVRLFPARALTRAFRRAIGLRGRVPLTYTNPAGHQRLRAELAAMLARTRGLFATADNIIVTRSIEQGIDLVARAARPGRYRRRRISYAPARSVMKLAGARLIPVPVDAQGHGCVSAGNRTRARLQRCARLRFPRLRHLPHATGLRLPRRSRARGSRAPPGACADARAQELKPRCRLHGHQRRDAP